MKRLMLLIMCLMFSPSFVFAQIPTLRANGKIAFTSNRDGNQEIYLMNNNGTNQVRLTNNSGRKFQPLWQPLLPAAPGDLDATFGTGGKVTTNVGGYSSATNVVLQADGKIVVVSNFLGTLVRYNTNGSLDASFGNGGIVNNGFSHPASGIALQTDGRIVVAGALCSASNCDFAIVRYLSNGSLDQSFDGDGIVILDMGNDDTARDVAIQPDGKIIIAGQNGVSGSRNYAFAVARLNSDGSLDISFDGDGRTITSLGSFSDYGAVAVSLQTDGKIVAAGQSGSGNFATADFALVRYNADGSLDTTFDGDGKLTTAVSNDYDVVRGVAVQTDGRIIAAGSSSTDFALVRYNADGSLDTTFDGDGKVSTDFGTQFDSAYSVAVQSNGKIVAAGFGGLNFALARYNPNGSLDTSFGTNGKVTTDFGSDGNSNINAVAIQPDGKIVSVGSYGADGEFDVFAVARYIGDSVISNRKLFDFDGDGRADISVFRPSDQTWYLNQSTAGFFATQFGLSTDKITPADFDGDGKTDISVYRNGTWYLLRSTDGFGQIQFGQAGDIPQPADFDGDGKSELVVYRGGTWFSYNLANNQVNTIQFGVATDKPVVADYDGDGRADQAVYRNGEWHLNQSSQGYKVVQFGLSTDKPVIGDFDGDGKTDQAVYRDGIWYVLQSSQGFTAFQFGIATDIPASADYDGDGKTDAAVFRDGTWYLRQSTNGISIQQFGLPNDQPIPAINAGKNGFVDGIENLGDSETLSKKKSEVVLATKTWDGGGATENWSDAANWSGDTVPLSADTVVFDATSVKNVTIDVNITVAAWQITAGYIGTISQGTSTVTASGSFSQSGGTFSGGSNLLDFNQPFTQSGGIFTASSGTTSFASSLNLSGGTFNHNNGTIVFDNGSGLMLPATLNLNNLTINSSSSNAFQTNSTIVVAGTLTLTNGSVSNSNIAVTGIINATGNVSIAATYDGGTTNILIDGAATRTVTFPAGAVIPRLTVNSANITLETSGSGTVTFQQAVDIQNIVGFTYSTNLIFQGAFSYGTSATMSGSGNITMGLFLSFTQSNGTIMLLGASTFTQSSGTFTQSGGTFTGGSGLIDFNLFSQSGGTFTASTGTTSFAAATTISGTFNHNGGTVVFDGSSGITLSAPLNLNNLTINATSFLLLDNGLINVAGTLNLTNGSIATNGGGIVNALGNVAIAATYDGGSATLSFSGAANQTYSDAGGIKPSGIWTVNKSGGTLTLNNDLNISNGTSNLNLTDGTITTGANIVIAGTRTIARTNGFINGNLRRTFSVASSRQFDVGTINGYAPVTINATAGAFPATFTVGGKNGTLPSADTTKSLTRNWSLTPNGITSANLTFQYLDTDVPISANENNFKFLRYNGTISSEGITSINTVMNIATLNGVTIFSDWSLGLLVPLAANAAISGQVTTADGQAIARTRVSITDTNGETRTTLTSSFGYYRFDEVEVGQIYVVDVRAKRFQFTPQVVSITEEIKELNFIAER